MRHAIRLGAWSPLLAVFGATPERSYVDVDADLVTVRFGPSLHRIARADVTRASRGSWSLLGGIGWRVGPRTLGLIGALDGIVRLELSRPHEHRVVVVPMRFDTLYLSMQDPDALLRDLGS